MNGTGRPCENPTTNIAVLPLHLVYFFAQGMCLYLLRSGFSVGLPVPRQRRHGLSGVLAPKFLGRAAPRPAALHDFLYRSLYEAFLPLPSSLAACSHTSRC